MTERVRAVLVTHGLTGDITELPEPGPTAAATAAQLGCEVGAIANSLVFSVNGTPLLVLASGAHRVDTRKVARLLGVGRAKIRSASPEFVRQVTGQEVGGVAPVGHPQPLRTLVDVHLDNFPHVWAGAGLHHTVFRTTFTELLKLTDGEAADIKEITA
ncbi:YbaK/EbsC family protein [Streptomyces sp. NPDC059443]|uniref:YbaK/EbsC family protein n=1 Tax=unclassified Streptomyces TaxID=2593676 RepID=UPI0036991086